MNWTVAEGKGDQGVGAESGESSRHAETIVRRASVERPPGLRPGRCQRQVGRRPAPADAYTCRRLCCLTRPGFRSCLSRCLHFTHHLPGRGGSIFCSIHTN